MQDYLGWFAKRSGPRREVVGKLGAGSKDVSFVFLFLAEQGTYHDTIPLTSWLTSWALCLTALIH